MSQINRVYSSEAEKVDASELDCQLRLYSPHPAFQVVIISDPTGPGDRFVPQRMMHIANRAMNEFQLSPSQVVWIEHTPAECSPSHSAIFHLIQFDWQAGQATSPHRSRIYEDWYLSWLGNKLYPS